MSYSIKHDFNFKSLLIFALPTIIMMIFTSLYTVVDGMIVARIVGADGLSAVNIVFPIISVGIGIGVMLGAGGSARIARKIGEGRLNEARENLSFLVLVGFLVGVIFSILGLIFINPVVKFLGATDGLMSYCIEYLRVLLIFLPFQVLQIMFQILFVTAGKPNLGLILTVLAGVANAVLDYIFMSWCDMGIAGAAWATIIGYLIPSIAGVIYFMKPRGDLYLVKFKPDKQALIESLINGSSEMVTNLSGSVTTFLFNILMIEYYGIDGVAAISVVLYSQFLFIALHLGYSGGVAPIISYNYGAGNKDMLKKIFKICVRFIIGSSIVIVIGSFLAARPVVLIFLGSSNSSAYDITIRGFMIFSTNYVFAGINIFSSGLFTALSNGKISATISFLRTFVFIVLGIMLLPKIMGADGIWLSIPFAEYLTTIVSVTYLFKMRKVYNYT